MRVQNSFEQQISWHCQTQDIVKEFRIKHCLNIVLKTHIMIFNVSSFNDYVYEYVSNVVSIKILNSS
jgi:hypothetical protein